MAVISVINQTSHQELGDQIREAKTFFQRARGLLGKKTLNKGEGLYIPNCRSIHTFFMRFPIDVVFIDKNNRIIKKASKLMPFRMTFGPFRTAGVLELTAGTLNDNRCNTGDKISFKHTGRE